MSGSVVNLVLVGLETLKEKVLPTAANEDALLSTYERRYNMGRV